MRRKCLALLLVCVPAVVLLPWSPSARAQATGSASDAVVSPDTSLARLAPALPSLKAVRASGTMRVDGRLDESSWSSATPFRDFRQRDPQEGQPASERTEVRVLVDDDAIYVGARMYDSEPSRIRARLARRDEDSQSDLFEVFFDTFRDHLTATNFRVNPAGALRDAVVHSSGDEDGSWDAVWEGSATVDSLGWCAEMRIPLSQLHYNAARDAAWGVQFERFIHRKQELDVFAFTPKSQSGGVSRYGMLTGLGPLPSRRHLEIVPYVSSRAEYRDVAAGNPFRSGSDYFAGMGLDMRYDIGRDLSVTATVNPDFGQAEVDPAEVNLSAYETFYSEKRPFFVEGAGYFSFGRYRSLNNFGFGETIYSRRIGRPPHLSISDNGYAHVDEPDQSTILGAVKLTGKTRGGWSLGLLDAVTGRMRARFVDGDGARGESEVEPPTNFFVGRVRRDLRDGMTSVGVLLSAANRGLETPDLRSSLRSAAYLGGVDFNQAWHNREWSLDGFYAQSYVRGSATAIAATQRSSAHYFQRPDQGHVQYDATRTWLSGYQGALSLAKNSGEHWLGSVTTQFMSPEYESNDLGYVTRADRYTFATIILYKQDRPGKVFRNYRVYPYTYHAWNYGGKLITAGYALSANAELANYWSVNGTFTRSPSVYNDQLTRGGPITRTANGNEFGVGVFSDSRKAYTTFAELYHWWNDRGGHGESYEAGLSVHPRPGLQITVGPELDRSHVLAQYVQTAPDPSATATYGRRYVYATIDQTTLSLGTRVNWTFSPRVSLQLYLQPLVSSGAYSGFKELRAPGTFDFDVYGQDRGSIELDTTNTYVINPGGPGTPVEIRVDNPDFNFRSLRGNAVLRWEYRPGSTLYFIWQQTREETVPTGDFSFRRDFKALFQRKPDNVFMLKITSWFGV
ncbi:MAG: carbohydrate binding family 9 domain-containing protein [Candidatus Eisenbacteria bacterium]|nr:carbohydrate binding family 9 domain-containing protein [Candidatus Eisenbacteria bacterium]